MSRALKVTYKRFKLAQLLGHQFTHCEPIITCPNIFGVNFLEHSTLVLKVARFKVIALKGH